MEVKKLDYLNVAKGIAITLVVIGHAISKNIVSTSYYWLVLRNIIYTVHMPVFFIVAGMLFYIKKEKYSDLGIRSYVVNKFRIYIIPYVSMNIVAVCLFLIISIIPKLNKMVEIPISIRKGAVAIVKSVVFFINPIDEHLWFAYVMFLVLTLALLVYKFCNNSRNRKICAIILIGVLFMLSYFYPLPDLIKKVIRDGLYFLIGYYIQGCEFCNRKKVFHASIVSYICFFTIYQNVFSDNNNYMPIQGLLLLAIGVSGALNIILASKVLCSKLNGLKRLFVCLNDYSYPIYLYQQPFLVSGTVIILTKFGCNLLLTVLVASLVGTIVPILVYKYIVSKSRTLNALFGGGR